MHLMDRTVCVPLPGMTLIIYGHEYLAKLKLDARVVYTNTNQERQCHMFIHVLGILPFYL